MNRKIVTMGLALTATLFAGAAYGEQPSVTQPSHLEQKSNSDKVEKPFYQHINELEMQDPELWIFIGVTTGSGAIGGLIYYLMNFREIQNLLILMNCKENKCRQLAGQPQVQKSDSKNTKIFANLMCCTSKMAIGAAAAPAVILLLRPECIFGSIATSIVAGSAGTAVLKNVQKKLMELEGEAEENSQKKSTKLTTSEAKSEGSKSLESNGHNVAQQSK